MDYSCGCLLVTGETTHFSPRLLCLTFAVLNPLFFNSAPKLLQYPMADRRATTTPTLAELSAQKAAAELNRRKIASASGGKWHATTVIRLRERLTRANIG